MIALEFNGSEAIKRLDSLPDRLRQELVPSIGRIALKLQIKVQTEKLNGQVLNVRTGRLRRSINNVVEQDGDVVSGVVSTPVSYGRAWEYGFQGTVTVREHLRTIKEAFGVPIPPKDVDVRAHERKVNMPERSFLRSALRELQESGAIAQEIDAAIARSVA